MRPAAQAREEDFSAKLGIIGFRRVQSASTVFFRPSTGCRCVVHGDDFTFMSFGDEIKDIIKAKREWYTT